MIEINFIAKIIESLNVSLVNTFQENAINRFDLNRKYQMFAIYFCWL